MDDCEALGGWAAPMWSGHALASIRDRRPNNLRRPIRARMWRTLIRLPAIDQGSCANLAVVQANARIDHTSVSSFIAAAYCQPTWPLIAGRRQERHRRTYYMQRRHRLKKCPAPNA